MLASGKIIPIDLKVLPHDINIDLATKMQYSRLISYYEKLNSERKQKAFDYLKGLCNLQNSETELNSEIELNAAHKRTDIDIPEDIDTSEDNIMDDNNF